MKKLLDFGRKAMFYLRVISGYEERRIRNYRLMLEQRLQKAEARKAELRRIPEQAILAEVRRMVEEMQSLNKQLDETDAAIKEYFKPIDVHAEMIVKTKLEGEDRTMNDMMEALKAEAMVEQVEAEKVSKGHNVESVQSNKEIESNPSKQHAQ